MSFADTLEVLSKAAKTDLAGETSLDEMMDWAEASRLLTKSLVNHAEDFVRLLRAAEALSDKSPYWNWNGTDGRSARICLFCRSEEQGPHTASCLWIELSNALATFEDKS